MKKGEEFGGGLWQKRGYFGVPPPPTRLASLLDERADPWQVFAAAVDLAKQGKFAVLPRLVDVYYRWDDARADYAWSLLLGDAAPGSHFASIIQELENPRDPEDYELAIDFSNALASRGRLADVPLLLQVYKRHVDVKDADVLSGRISNLLAPEPGAIADGANLETIGDYLEMVMERYQELVETLGSDQVLVLGGEQFGVRRLARQILAKLQQPYFLPFWRRKFEAATGIDGTRFFKEGVIQPLAAAALVEEFLESPEAAKYEDGVRYFFGHRIPD